MSDLVTIRDRARFTGPRSRSNVVERTRLDNTFDSATGRVVRVLAPAGYGKSTLVARWVAGDDRRVIWLDLEPIDNDPLVLGHALVKGLDGHRTPDTDCDAARRAPLDELTHLVADAGEPFVLVLDDIHHIVSEESAHLICLIVDKLPPDSTLVLSGRVHHHGEAVARHRLQPGVVDVTVDALAFDLAETEEMLTLLGLESDIDTITLITEQLEGWPAGLRLAGLALTRGARGSEIALGRLGDLADVTDYVTQEWFSGLGEEDQDFLTEIACLGRFSGAQCDVVLGRHDSASTLRRLCRDELLLVALDQHNHWYRMHTVLARWLSSRLQSLDHDRWRRIHLATAEWWSSEGDIDLAVEHVTAAGDLERLEELVALHSASYVARGMYRTIDRWMQSFSNTRIRRSLPLRNVKTLLAIAFGDGDQALSWVRLSRVDHVPIDHAVASVNDVLAYQTDTLYAALENLPAAELIPAATRAYRHLPPGEWRALACLVLGGNHYLCGDERAAEMLYEARFETEVANSTTLQALASATLAIMLDLDGSIDEADELSRRALRLVGSPHLRDTATTAIPLALAALVGVRAGRQEEAVEHHRAARLKLEHLQRCAPWFNILVRIPLIRASLLLDDAPTALELLRELERRMQAQDPSTPLARYVDELGTAVRAANDIFADRSWALTAAELRVLHHLPTNLSLADIARRLYVSRNTVKSHAAAIYRKLDTTSRTEAVALARAAGLITETSRSR